MQIGGRGCLGGEYEVLRSDIDEEEPDAVLVISIGLNQALQTGMATTHLEIFSAMESLCNPNQTRVPFVSGNL